MGRITMLFIPKLMLLLKVRRRDVRRMQQAKQQIAVRLGIIGLEAESLAIAGNGLIQLAKAFERIA